MKWFIGASSVYNCEAPLTTHLKHNMFINEMPKSWTHIWISNPLRLEHHVSPPERAAAAVSMGAILANNNNNNNNGWLSRIQPTNLSGWPLKKAKHGSSSVVILTTWQCVAGPFGVLHHCCFPPSFLRPPLLAEVCLFKTLDHLLPLLQNRHKQALGSADSQGLQVYHSAFAKLCVCVCVCDDTLEEKWLWMTLNMQHESLTFS